MANTEASPELDFASFCTLLQTHDFFTPEGEAGMYWDVCYEMFGEYFDGGTGGGFSAQQVFAWVKEMAAKQGCSVQSMAVVRGRVGCPPEHLTLAQVLAYRSKAS